jgi:hypothetical protein
MLKLAGLSGLVALALAACASTGWPTQVDATAMSDTPEHFLVLDAASGATSEPGDPACRNPLVDPRNGARLTLERSSDGFGDYRPDAPRYGLAADQLLRIDCRSGRALGVTR